MVNAQKTTLIALVEKLEAELRAEPSSAGASQVLHQCERLHQAIRQSHAEGLRFAAFTLGRLMQQLGANFSEATQDAGRELSQALGAAGYGH